MNFPSVPLPRFLAIAVVVSPLIGVAAAFVQPVRHALPHLIGAASQEQVDSLRAHVDTVTTQSTRTDKNVQRLICHADTTLAATPKCHELGWGLQ